MSILHRTRLTAWLAAFAVAIAALAPTLTQAMAWAGDGSVRWVEVCTVLGVKMVAMQEDGADTDAPASGDLPSASCPYCSPHAGSFALPPGSALAVAALQPRETLFSAPSAAPPPAASRGIPQPRAPPYPA
ncbi:DUF2946 domain-containing protein [Pseudothauera nasutitermitis]|uniref:DUF2946 domain-containing protein n=1 Tax=Pseudothauera nasutitermitis TaxID=2565930 RepID=A0A4S4B3A0_9RHOO|nr:DUF2946 domain-containing protein [Pseudothauera nasutitermitis]THF67112.1 DUF2946 domain-containing protein [Pseudothauera nasutitermitis]